MSRRSRYSEEEPYRSTAGGKRPRTVSPPPSRKRPSFPSYLDTPDLAPNVRLLCEILATTPSSSIEPALSNAGVRLTPDDAEEVLKLSYSHPGPAVKFFRWTGGQLHHNHSPYAWNLVVDLLGKNLLFDAMWDTVGSMRSERLLSLATFASVFGSYAAASRPADALAAFDSMDSRYGIPRDSAALNTLLSALCREGLSTDARDFLVRVGRSAPPDSDTYAIILEVCENERDPTGAHKIFCEMISTLGWDPNNIPAYDSFLSTLVRSPGGVPESLKFLSHMKEKHCYPGMKFFRAALQVFAKENDAARAIKMWDVLIGRNGCNPDTRMYNSMIALQCYVNQFEVALQFMDEMIIYGAFPDEETYEVMLQYLLKGRKLNEATTIFREMVKNEFCPSKSNCETALKVFLDAGGWDMGVKVWDCMVANDMSPLEDSANMLVLRLKDLDRVPEVCKLAEDMIERGIKLNSSTLSRLKATLQKMHKGSIYDEILKKWKGFSPLIGGDGLSRYRTDFHEIEQIGWGNFSHVFKVLKRLDGCTYAVKQCIRQLYHDVERRRAMMEVQALASLGCHENIVGYHTSWFENHQLYIQMELCERSLSIDRDYIPNYAQVLEVLHQMAKALHFIHERGIAHLDVKPDNIYVKNNTYKLGDFGCATRIDRSLPIEEGDSRYMPQEMLNNQYEHLDKVDIFSLGVAIYELVKGSPLPDSGPQFSYIREGRLPLLPGYSMQFQALLKAMMNPDPMKRPSAKEIMENPIFEKARRGLT